LLPYWHIRGKPSILLDLVKREFTFFGLTLLPTDTLLLALFMVSLFLTIFLATALLGRVWCCWACPQTVYLEFVFRPIERFFDGTLGKGGKPSAELPMWRRVGKYGCYLLVAMFLAHTFLAYFVGVEQLAHWVSRSPFEHPAAFLVMAVTTGLMLFDFCFFREQLCLVACPYGRLQSVLLDRRSMIVAYDTRRGEPRGKMTLRTVKENHQGDCIDCGLCVRTCPTGIDIRDGLQMECVHCTQCMDACNEIMTRIGRPKNLIRYSCQESIEGSNRGWLRPRLVLYPLLLLASVSTFIYLLGHRSSIDVTVLRNLGNPFMVTKDGEVQNSLRLKLVNRLPQGQNVKVEIVDAGTSPLEKIRMDMEKLPWHLESMTPVTQPILFTVPRSAFRYGVLDIKLMLTGEDEEKRILTCRLIGP
jgi:cytochrome c oxidase accessory protein FixG